MYSKNDLLATMRCEPNVPIPCKLDWPVRKVCYWGGHPGDVRPADTHIWTDEWGVTWRKESPDPELMPFPIAHPLEEEWDDLDTLTWPEIDTSARFADLANLRCPSHELLVGEHPFALYERAWLIAGMQNLLTMMASEPDEVDALFARIGEFQYAVAQAYVALHVEVAWIADDYGMNSALMFSPEMWLRFVKPHLQRMVDCYHQARIPVVLHSCGNITPLIDEFLKIGIDVLDPLQPDCNRLDEIRRKTAGRMCLCGGVAATALLTNDIERTTRDTHHRIETLGRTGGYIVGPDDEQTYPDTTRSAMLQAVQSYRDSRIA